MRKVKKAKWLFVVLALAMILAMVPAVGGAQNGNGNGDECGFLEVPLIAGQHMEVGTVTVENDGDELCVTYALDVDALGAGWLIYETHLAIAPTGGEDHPYDVFRPLGWVNRPGNPIPGQFPYGDDELDGVAEWSVCISLEELGVDFCNEVFIAAHAVVKRIVEEAYCETIVEAGDDLFVSDTETMVVESDNFVTPFPAELAWVHPSWNQNLTRAFDDDAEWIWESEYVVRPIDGDVVTFEKEFEVPGLPLGGTIFITADNGFAVSLNGEFLYNSPSLLQYPDLGDLKADYVDRTGWQTVREVDLTGELVQGDNTLTIIGVNEYQGPDDGFSDGTVISNPGGVIFEFDVDWDEVVECYPDVWQDETAWGEGDRFNQRGNWGMFFTYKICEPEVPCDAWIVYGSNLGTSPNPLGFADTSSDAIFAIDLMNKTVSVAYDPGELRSDQNYPNGNAYDPVNQWLFFATDQGNLYFYDMVEDAQYGPFALGSGQIASGAWYDGDYYYVPQGSTAIYKVEVGKTGASRTLAGSLGRALNYGDIVFDINRPGVLFGSGGGDNGYYFTFDFNSNTYAELRTGVPHKQLAYASNGVLYGVTALTGNWYEINPVTGEDELFWANSTWNGQTIRLTDLADGPLCE